MRAEAIKEVEKESTERFIKALEVFCAPYRHGYEKIQTTPDKKLVARNPFMLAVLDVPKYYDISEFADVDLPKEVYPFPHVVMEGISEWSKIGKEEIDNICDQNGYIIDIESDIRKICESCGGEGTVLWVREDDRQTTRYDYCDECGGMGDVKTGGKMTTTKVNDAFYVGVMGQSIAGNRFDVIAKASKQLNMDVKVMKDPNQRSMLFVKIGKIRAIIAGVVGGCGEPVEPDYIAKTVEWGDLWK